MQEDGEEYKTAHDQLERSVHAGRPHCIGRHMLHAVGLGNKRKPWRRGAGPPDAQLEAVVATRCLQSIFGL